MVWLKSDLKSSEKPSRNVYWVVFFLCWSLFRFPRGVFSSKPPSPEEILTKSQRIPELSTFDIYSYNFLKAINKDCKLCLNCEKILSICGQPAIDAFLNININISMNISNINNINKIFSLRPHQPEPHQSSLNNMIKSVSDKARLWSDSGPTC